MVLGAVGFMQNNLTLLIAALFLMGLHSTIFGPVKYSILPQHLKDDEIVGGNGMVEMGTFLAILAGTILGGLLHRAGTACGAGVGNGDRHRLRGLPDEPRHTAAPPAAPALKINWNPVTETWAKPQIHEAEPHGVSVGARHFVVLVLRRDSARAVSELLQGRAGRRRTRRDPDVDHVFNRRRHRFAVVRTPVRPQGRDRAGAVRFDRSHRIRARSVFCESIRGRRPARRRGGFSGAAGQRAHPVRSAHDRRIRRLLHRAALRIDPDPFGAQPSVAHHRRQQHPQRAVHGGVGRHGCRAAAGRADDSADLPRRRRCSTPRSRFISTRWCPNS